MNIIELTDLELEILEACLEVISDLPCGFEAINGYVEDNEETWNAIQTLRGKI